MKPDSIPKIDKDLYLKAVADHGSPLYAYNFEVLRERLNLLKASLPQARICFALKANNNLAIMKEIFSHGLGSDVVSVGEIKKSIFAGINPKKIVFSGVGKTYEELHFAVKAGVGLINIESAFEVDSIQRAAKSLDLNQSVCIRVNPNIQIDSNPKISTGLDSVKFGVPLVQLDSVVEHICSSSHMELLGLACHIGSQMLDLAPLKTAADQMADLSLEIQKKHGVKLKFINLGGGLGISYHGEESPDVEEYAGIVQGAADRSGLRLVLELGRWIAAPVGVLLSEVIGVKKNQSKNFIVIDAGMNDLLRPALYDAEHSCSLIQRSDNPTANSIKADVVGPVCETSDCFNRDVTMPEPVEKDVLLFDNAGAYGFSMASNYNIRPMAAEIAIDYGKSRLIRSRQTYEDLWKNEII